MSLIELHPDLTQLVKHTARVADALEQLLIQAYGYHTVPPKADKRGEPASVDYTDDMAGVKQELEQVLESRRVREDDDAEEEAVDG